MAGREARWRRKHRTMPGKAAAECRSIRGRHMRIEDREVIRGPGAEIDRGEPGRRIERVQPCDPCADAPQHAGRAEVRKAWRPPRDVL